ncbi:hypothetical protein CSC35_5296 [Enterobacter hormaechei]|uniref:Uncharacterized protein n=2 Tax=Enterobacteriaceae TaxID=543 RepID=A0A3G2CD32_CITFR|nr:Hypothetical protein [Klebsiella pneumoniae]AYM50543.1 hypothetical protein [Citrobacter freundii]QHW09336.1 hypothetical protein [Enterobacteriaceae bacterium]RAL76332.1 hypothetical protein CSC35_5296 [Enterobacter hormaechei]UKS51770.1 hypothetical protein [Enterobacter cloacae]UVN20080.1 hypothetical protein [Klebsiella michiganensis]
MNKTKRCLIANFATVPAQLVGNYFQPGLQITWASFKAAPQIL